MAGELKEEILWRHREFLEERIDPDSGLLDVLFSYKILSRGEISDIRAKPSYRKRNTAILNLIMDKHQRNGLVKALKETGQLHLANYLNADALYRSEFKDNWPLTEKEMSILDANQRVLVDLIDPDDLVGRLFSRGVINSSREREAITSKQTCHERNEVFLEILSRRSAKDFRNTIHCLNDSNQRHIAEIFDKGGVITKVHAEGLDHKTKDDIIAEFKRILKNKTPEERRRILDVMELDVISMEEGESVVLYVCCKTLNELLQLKEMKIKSTLRTAVQRLFMKLLTLEQNVEVSVEANLHNHMQSTLDLRLRHSQVDGMTVILSEDDYESSRSYFSEGIRLRAVCDFNPKKLSHKVKNEHKDILQSTKSSMIDEGSKIADEAIRISSGQQEDKRQFIASEDEGNEECEMEDNDWLEDNWSEDECSEDEWSEDDRSKDHCSESLRFLAQEEHKSLMQTKEDNDVMKTKLDEETILSTCIQREHERSKIESTEAFSRKNDRGEQEVKSQDITCEEKGNAEGEMKDNEWSEDDCSEDECSKDNWSKDNWSKDNWSKDDCTGGDRSEDNWSKDHCSESLRFLSEEELKRLMQIKGDDDIMKTELDAETTPYTCIQRDLEQVKIESLYSEAFSLTSDRGEQEVKSWDITCEEKGNAEGEMKGNDWSEGDQWIREKDKQKLKRKAQIIEDDNITETEPVVEATGSTYLQRGYKRLKFMNLSYENETRLSQTQNEASMTNLENSENGSKEDSKTEYEYLEAISLKSDSTMIDEYESCRSYFPEDIKLRAVCYINPEEMSHRQIDALEDILQSTKNSPRDEGRIVADKTNTGRQEDKWQDIAGEEEGNAEGEMKVEGWSEGDQSKREKDKQTFKRKVELEEDDDTVEKELEPEAIPSTSFHSEHKRVKFTDCERDKETNETEARLSPTQKEASVIELKDTYSEPGSEDLKTELEYSEYSSDSMSNEQLNSKTKTKALSFRKGDLMETIPPADIGDFINRWKVRHLESGEIGYIRRNHVVINYELDLNQRFKTFAVLKEVSSETSDNSIPLALLDSILLKSYLQRVLRQKNKDYDTIGQLASVERYWFERIRRRKFKKEVWRNLVGFYREQGKATSIYRINRQYLEENIQLQGLVNRLKANDCLTDLQTASLYRRKLPLRQKESFNRFRDIISAVVKNIETIHSVFIQNLWDTKQNLIGKIVEDGRAVVKVEFKFRSVITRYQNLELVEGINKIRDKEKAIKEFVGKLKYYDLEILSASQDGDVIIVWMWCKTKNVLERLQTLYKSKHIIDVFTELVKNLSFSSEERNPAMVKPKVNIDCEQFEKTVVFFPIVANFTSKLDFGKRDEEGVKGTTEYQRVEGVTKLRNKIYVLLRRYYHPDSHCEILVFEDQIPFRLQKKIEIKEIKYPKDIASIEIENSLYMIEWRGVWKIKGDEEEKKEKIILWLEFGYGDCVPRIVSVTRDGRLLLVCYRYLRILGGGESDKADFRLPLPEDIQHPIDAAETFRGNFIISHEKSGSAGRRRQNLIVVSEVSKDGKTILRCFVPMNKEQRLCHSSSLAVDSFDRVFLADYLNNRVILFDSDLQWNGILIPTEEDGQEGRRIHWPCRLFYDEEKKQLIVGGSDGFVFTLNRKWIK